MLVFDAGHNFYVTTGEENATGGTLTA